MIFTVFTPTFNRAHTIHRVYESLCDQTFTDFEWLVVDDGSDDNTENLILNWQRKAKFPIRYKKQRNTGKHLAINQGVNEAKGELFIIADSDDKFPSNALEIFYCEWIGIEISERGKFTGVTGLCVDCNDQIIGDKFPNDIFDSTPAETFYRYGITGEKWGFHRTGVLLEFPFPANAKGVFYPEGLVWNKIGKKYLTRYINRPVRVYFSDAGNQLTSRSIEKRAASWIFYAEMIYQDEVYIKRAPLRLLKLAIQGCRLSLHHHTSVSEQLSELKSLISKFLWIVGLPIACILYFGDKVRSK